MSYYQVIAIPRTGSPTSPRMAFVDRKLHTEVYKADERLQELTALYPYYDVRIIVVSAEERRKGA